MIRRKFPRVLDCVYKMATDIIKLRDLDFRAVHLRLQSPQFSPHFDTCVGAIDVTHYLLSSHHQNLSNILDIMDIQLKTCWLHVTLR